MSEANERARWTPWDARTETSYLVRRKRDGGDVIAAIQRSKSAGVYIWEALTDPPTKKTARGYYAAQRAVRQALRG